MSYGGLAAIAVLALAGAAFVLVRARQAGVAMQRALAELREEAYEIRSAIGAAREDQTQSSSRIQEELNAGAQRLGNLAEAAEETVRMVHKGSVEFIHLYRALCRPVSDLGRVHHGQHRPEALPSAVRTTRKTAPAVSLVLTVRNGMPHLPSAIDSVRAQDFRDFELIVQDCVSNDGSLEYLRSIADLPVLIESTQDDGIGDAWQRAVSRCSGEVLGSIDADNLLKPDALSTALAIFDEHPDAAAFYGGIELINERGEFQSCFIPRPFDVLELIGGQLVPPWSTAFFSRARCGSSLYFDPTIRVCTDFDIWLRISDLTVLQTDKIIGSTRISPESMTCRIEAYDSFCAAKIQALENYVKRRSEEALNASLMRYGSAAIYCWAAESVERLGAGNADVLRYADLALQKDPLSDRAKGIQSRLADMEYALHRLQNMDNPR